MRLIEHLSSGILQNGKYSRKYSIFTKFVFLLRLCPSFHLYDNLREVDEVFHLTFNIYNSNLFFIFIPTNEFCHWCIEPRHFYSKWTRVRLFLTLALEMECQKSWDILNAKKVFNELGQPSDRDRPDGATIISWKSIVMSCYDKRYFSLVPLIVIVKNTTFCCWCSWTKEAHNHYVDLNMNYHFTLLMKSRNYIFLRTKTLTILLPVNTTLDKFCWQKYSLFLHAIWLNHQIIHLITHGN